MLHLALKAHRDSLQAGTSDPQKLFVLLKVIPDAETARSRPPLALALVVDTSGSMRDKTDAGTAGGPGGGTARSTKLDHAIKAAQTLVNDERLLPEDQITIIQFNDQTSAVLPLSPLGDRKTALRSVRNLVTFSGGTRMAKGLNNAHRELGGCTAGTAQRVIVLTDGQTFDEADCRTAGQRLADANAPLVAIGVGEDYNEELLRDLAEVGRGRPYHLQQMGELSEVLDFEVSTSVREVVTNLQAEFKTVSGVGLTGVTRVYPSLAEMNLNYLVGHTPPPNNGFLALGNIASGDYTVFVLEVTISGMSRPAGRARLMQLQLSGFVPGLNQKAETPLQDVWVEFTPSEDAITQVDEEVLGYVQQRNADRLVQDALQEAKSDLPRARRTLQSALHMTRLIGNATVTRMIEKSLDELDTTGTISPDTRKTVALAGRTRTVKTTGAQTLDNLPSDETIRRLTGA